MSHYVEGDVCQGLQTRPWEVTSAKVYRPRPAIVGGLRPQLLLHAVADLLLRLRGGARLQGLSLVHVRAQLEHLQDTFMS